MTAKRSSRPATDAQINYLCVLAQKVELVRKINNNDPREQELINRLEIPEQKAIRKLTILLFSMENFFKRTAEDRKRKCDVFQIWEERNRMDWNEWYHTQADLLEEEINGYSFEYADKSKHGWCL